MKPVELVLFHSFERSWFDTKNLRKLDTHITRVAAYLAKRGRRVTFHFLTKGKNQSFRHTRGFPVCVHHIDIFPGSIPLEWSRGLLHEARRADPQRPRIWHLNTYYYLMAAGMVPILKKRKQHIVLHHRGGGWTLRGLLYYCVQYCLILPWLLRLADKIIVQNTAEERKLVRILRIPCERVVRIPNGVDCSLFRPLPRSASRASLGLPTDKTVLLFVGRIERTKGSRLVLQIAERIRAEDALIVLVGDGADRVWLEREVARRGLAAKLVFARRFVAQNELVQWYSASDMLIHPNSYGEGSPNTVLEAQACGLPIVGFDVPGVQDSIKDGVTGVLVKKCDGAKFADAVLQFLPQARLTKTRHACRAWIRDTFKYESAMLSLEKVYDEL